jgi:HEAT repeat protein/beta-lactamase regulating signal transducer with metallopeptidase domain
MSFIDTAASFISGFDSAGALAVLDVLVKVTLLLGAASLVSLALGRASAAVRHMVWSAALTSALLVPVLSFALPRWQINLVTVDAPATPVAAAAEPAPATPAPRRSTTPRVDVESGTAAVMTGIEAPAAAATRLSSIPLSTALVAIWLAGVGAVLARLAIGLVAVQWMRRRTAPVLDAPWLPLAVDLAAGLGITQRVTFLESRSATMPMAFGIFKPAVLMPADAVRWPVERLRIVLLHELAHVRRRDCLTHTVAQVACAIYWFNPLAWVAARRIRAERERACDDLVLACGTRGSDYAEELLEIARVMRAGRFPALVTGATLAMAHRTQLEGRLIAILDPKLPRSGVSRRRALVAVATVGCILPPLAAMQPWTVTAAAPAFHALEPASTPLAELTTQQLPTPKPAPTPSPTPSPQPASDAVAQAVAELATGTTEAALQGVADGITNVAIQAATNGITQATANGSIDVAIEAAVSAVAGIAVQEAKRAAADPKMVAALSAALKDSDKEVREAAMQALVQLRDPAVFEPLLQALKDAAAGVREQAAHALGEMRDKRAVEPLSAALKDENADVREQAAFALGQLRDPRSVDALVGALQDSSADVRQQAAFALGQLRDKRAAPALNALVKDADADVRQQAVHALGEMRDVSAVDGLIVALRDSNPDVRQQAAHALGQIRDPRAVAPLISALKDADADVRQQAAHGLGQLRDKSAVEALIIAVKDPDGDVRQQVVHALGQLRDPRAIDALTGALKDPSADVRQNAAYALGQLIR